MTPAEVPEELTRMLAEKLLAGGRTDEILAAVLTRYDEMQLAIAERYSRETYAIQPERLPLKQDS